MKGIIIYGLGILTGMVIMLFITGIINTIIRDHIDKK
jgi:hypothetical protein